jgi:hypothetical protein
MGAPFDLCTDMDHARDFGDGTSLRDMLMLGLGSRPQRDERTTIAVSPVLSNNYQDESSSEPDVNGADNQEQQRHNLHHIANKLSSMSKQ